jgi:hypothetical protein
MIWFFMSQIHRRGYGFNPPCRFSFCVFGANPGLWNGLPILFPSFRCDYEFESKLTIIFFLTITFPGSPRSDTSVLCGAIQMPRVRQVQNPTSSHFYRTSTHNASEIPFMATYVFLSNFISDSWSPLSYTYQSSPFGILDHLCQEPLWYVLLWLMYSDRHRLGRVSNGLFCRLGQPWWGFIDL